ncbi:MAG: nitroreductase family protein [Acidobacteriales bacterium]|nr:nitroreductase family protein [Terriglobales bacterium]
MAPAVMQFLEFHRLTPDEQLAQSRAFLARMSERRTVREFSADPVPFELIENAIRTAATAPSGANLQPWTFVVVSDPAVKKKVRAAAEKEEREFYEHRAPKEWLEALAPLGTDPNKPFLETAPCLIVCFQQNWSLRAEPDGSETKVKHYYATESVGLACGLLLASLHLCGLVTLTHTPSPMGFLREILGRPKNELPFLLIPVGFPAPEARTPVAARNKKPLEQVLVRV